MKMWACNLRQVFTRMDREDWKFYLTRGCQQPEEEMSEAQEDTTAKIIVAKFTEDASPDMITARSFYQRSVKRGTMDVGAEQGDGSLDDHVASEGVARMLGNQPCHEDGRSKKHIPIKQGDAMSYQFNDINSASHITTRTRNENKGTLAAEVKWDDWSSRSLQNGSTVSQMRPTTTIKDMMGSWRADNNSKNSALELVLLHDSVKQLTIGVASDLRGRIERRFWAEPLGLRTLVLEHGVLRVSVFQWLIDRLSASGLSRAQHTSHGVVGSRSGESCSARRWGMVRNLGCVERSKNVAVI